MNRTIFEKMNGSYAKQGDYFLPLLSCTVESENSFGVWAMCHWRYIFCYRRGFYTGLLLSGKLQAYLLEVDLQARELFRQIIDDRIKSEGISEKMKAENQMEWVCRMNQIYTRAKEIVDMELIYI